MMRGVFYRFCACFVCFFCVGRLLFASPIISKLVDNKEAFDKLKKYGFHNDKCDYFSNRLAVIENISYYGFDKEVHHDGEIVVLDILADDVVGIFDELLALKFPVDNLKMIAGSKIVPRGPFGWFGEKAVVDEDQKGISGAYVCRTIQYTDRLSLHSFGTAIDINTMQNPCIFINEETHEILKVVPRDGVMYLNRSFNRKGKEEKDFGKVNDEVINIFRKHGYDVWGGYWDFPIDYQHFQVSGRSFVELLILANEQDAKEMFQVHLSCLKSKNLSLSDVADEKDVKLLEMYEKDRDVFMKEIKSWCPVKTGTKRTRMHVVK